MVYSSRICLTNKYKKLCTEPKENPLDALQFAIFFRKRSHCVGKCKRGPLGIIKILGFCCKIWDPFETITNFRKSRKPEKKSKGDQGPFSLVRFSGLRQKTKFALAGLGLNSFGSFCRKWTDQWEVCGLKKKSSL